jgi:hypothetical protein
MERVNQYFKDRTELFDDYYPCMQKEDSECNLLHVHNGYNSLYPCIMIQHLRMISLTN